MNQNLTNQFSEYDIILIHNELYELIDRHFEFLNILQSKYERKIFKKYNRGSTDTIYDKMLDKIESLVNVLNEIENYKFKDDLYIFKKFIDSRRDTNHPERFYIRMYKDI